ncbi:MAG: AAA family ATPase [Gammaproteobacteria bacterium]
MLRLKALHLEDFGPFKGPQTIRIADEDGVTIVYGENMRGKTSLLNAIRFAFFGKVIGRGPNPLALSHVGNWEQAESGKFGFQVQLVFSEDERQYKLTRTCKPRPAVTTPRGDHDYVVDYFLEEDGTVLGPNQAETELKRILPEQISRFFLFDGELLQEYEDLLSTETDMGRRISEAIEKILGVPVLTSARATMLRLKDASERSEATAAQGDQKTQEFGNQQLELLAQRDVLTRDLGRLEKELEAERSNKSALEEALKKKERLAAILEKRDTLTRQVEEIKHRKGVKEAELKVEMGTAWCVLLHEPMSSMHADLRAREAILHTEILRADVLRDLQSDASSTCPACLQAVSPEARKAIEHSLHGSSEAGRGVKEHDLASIRRKLGALEQHSSTARQAVLRLLWDDVEDLAIDLSTKQSDRDELDKQLQNVDEEGLRRTKVEYENAIRQIATLEEGVAGTRKRIDEINSDAEQIQRRIDKLAKGNLQGERRRRETYSNLHKLFDAAVSAYRDQLRKRVEADATKHFRSLTTEPDYAGLRINDSYGLTIVHQDGSSVPVRSAGAEHVVALCLMGALQNNAPLRGPIVIDSPFGRLDSGHTRNIVRALPDIAKQVVLLVYDDELPPAIARTELRGKLRGEWRMERRSAKHTELVPRKD